MTTETLHCPDVGPSTIPPTSPTSQFPSFLSLYLSINGKLIKDLYNSYSMGENQYLWTRTKMHNIIFPWWNCASRYGLRAPPGAVVFAQDNDNVPVSGKTNTNNGQR